MGFFDWLFKKRDGFEEEVRNSFVNVKQDISKVSKWLSHFHDKHKGHEDNISEFDKRMEKLEKDMSDIKNFVDFFVAESSTGPFKTPFKRLSKQAQTAVQTGAVQTPVQTAVQTGFQTGALRGLTMMERTILFVLLNSKDKLSYDDISVLSGKDKSTVRGQINSIKAKSEGVISETVDQSGRKRYFIDETLKERILDDIIMARRAKRAKSEPKALKIRPKAAKKKGK